MKRAYLATVCFAPLVFLLLAVSQIVFLAPGLVPCFYAYEGVGLFVLLIGLWRSNASLPRKLIWPFLLVPFRLLIMAKIFPFGQGQFIRLVADGQSGLWLIAMPAYWLMEVRRRPAQIVPAVEHPEKPTPKAPENAWLVWAKRSIAPLWALAYSAFLPRLHIESLQQSVGRIASLWPFLLPALLLGAIICFAQKWSRWAAMLWTFLAAPLLAFILFANSMFMRPAGVGPDAGFVGMGTMFMLLFSLPIIIPGLFLLGACPKKEAWMRLPWAACIFAATVPFLGVQWGIRYATVPPTGKDAVVFARDYIEKYGGHSQYSQDGGFRNQAFVAMLKSPATPSEALAEAITRLPNNSSLWYALASNPNLPDAAVRARMGDPMVAAELARSPYLAPDILTSLATSSEPGILCALARNASTPRATLEKLAQSKDGKVRDFAKKNLAGNLGNFLYHK